MAVTKLKETIVLQSPPVGTAGTLGQRSGDWVSEKTVRAEVVKLSGRELESANQLYGSAQYRIRIWYDADLSINKNWRVSWSGKFLEIGDVDNANQKNKWYVLLCAEVE